MSKFWFGSVHSSSYDDYVSFEARNLEHAIKIFKVSELFPEKYVDDQYIKRNGDGYREQEYNHDLKRYEVKFKILNPKIKIYINESEEDDKIKWKEVGKLSLQECVNVDYKDIMPQKNLLAAPITETNEEEMETLPIIGDAKAVTQCTKIQLRRQHDAILVKQAELETLRQELNTSMDVLKKELSQKMKIIYIIETYLGIHEDVIQIKKGEAAPSSTPLTLYQQLLYMDEEVGVWGNDGIDFQTLDEFDQWIEKNYERYLYKPLSVCAFKVRRKDKDYGGDLLTNYFYNKNNKITYFVMRNGDQLYRIYSDVTIGGRLFPAQTEYQKMFEEEKKWGDESARDKMQAHHENYMYGLIAMQGLIERTDVLGLELRKHVNLTKPDGAPEEWVEFIRDDEPEFWITDGRPSWSEFLKQNRATIAVGTRICLATRPHHFSLWGKDCDDLWRCSPFRPSNPPSKGYCYTITATGKDAKAYRGMGHSSGDYKFYYMPSDEEFWDEDTMDLRPRKRRVPWIVYNDEVINFDEITIEQCEYYEQNRLERRDYIRLMPTLHWIKKVKRQELEVEQQFIKYLAGELKWDETRYDEIQEAITWWKLKNKWKRALSMKESTATRMILKRLGVKK